jgi:glutathione S-transferase
MPALKLHVLPPSHPCMTAIAALKLKGLEFEKVTLDMNAHHGPQIEEIYGEGNTTVPGLLVDDERVHGSVNILRRLEELAPSPPLYPDAIADRVREAEEWGDGDLQDLGRRLPWGALHFRPEMMGLMAGAGQLDPPGTDFAIRFARAAWKYHGITAQRLHEDLQRLPGLLDQIDAYAADGVLNGDEPNAADLQIGATIRVLQSVGDLTELLADRPASEIPAKFLPRGGQVIPAGAFPAGWVPAR